MNNNSIKPDYIPPIIKRIILDNEISLALESSPAPGPGEGALMKPEHIDNNPFKTNLV
jgi:hypothetical protein